MEFLGAAPRHFHLLALVRTQFMSCLNAREAGNVVIMPTGYKHSLKLGFYLITIEERKVRYWKMTSSFYNTDLI